MNYYITYFEIAAFASSIIAWPVIRKSDHLRWFPLLFFIIVSVEVHQTFFRSSDQSVNAGIYNVQVPIQHLLYLIILYFACKGASFRNFLKVAAILFVLFAVTTGLFFTPSDRFNVLAYCAGSLLIIIGIMIKFYEMLQHPTDFNFLKDPFFYILFAYLLFCVATLPYFAMSNWLYFVSSYKNIVRMFANVMSILNYVLYSTYTIAFIWMILRKE